MVEQQQIKRQTAYLCTAQQVLKGRYVRREGWDPSYLAADEKMFARVRLVGLVVEVSPAQVVIDDGSGQVSLRIFNGVLPPLAVGDPVLVIGRPREYNEERFVMAEIVRKLPSSAWLKRYAQDRQVLQSFVPAAPQEPVAVVPVQPSPSAVFGVAAASSSQPVAVSQPKGVNKADILLNLIRELDPGDGAPVDEVLARAGFPDADDRLQFLISEGEIFELRAGKVKVLE